MIPVEVKLLLENARYMGDGYAQVRAEDLEYLLLFLRNEGCEIKTEIELPEASK